ncbi:MULTISPECIES: helix-turn-helix domain-containing protein [unclassified Nocardia]|uniref:helix-turn-helix domain-containing protein n=1 Tax=unclassified Nocardia TaxID=2637762 RepID=UPI00278C39D4|nr:MULTISPECIES: helix-turn-helix transcriptional regulator [unclassified Nocardia]
MSDLGSRLQSVRKRRGLRQTELSALSGVSVSWIRKIEQGTVREVRLETLRKLAVALRVRTTVLQADDHDVEHADMETQDLWEPVRRALAGHHPDTVDEPASVDGVLAEFNALRPMLETHHYGQMATRLPMLLRDADSLDVSEEQGRAIRARLLTMAGWLLTQNRQFETAAETLDRAMDAADNRVDIAAAVNTKVWGLLRQGCLDEARDLAIRWADDIEPKFSRATARELAVWGRLWLGVANAAVRNNQPGETADALSLARAAAHRIGREIVNDEATVRTFGPVTVAHIQAEAHVIDGQPDKTLAIAEHAPRDILNPVSAGRLRHRLDVANAHTMLKQYGEAFAEIQELHALAPEWIVQQRYARDVLGNVIAGRRTLTDEMRTLADAIKLDY